MSSYIRHMSAALVISRMRREDYC